MSRLGLGALLVITWILLWGDWSVANLVSGVLVVTVLYVMFPSDRPLLPRTLVHPVALVLLIGYFLRQMVGSNLLLARELVSPRARIRARIIEVPMRTSSRPFLTLISNITALTPGTMPVAVQADPPVITLHVLDLQGPHEVSQSLRRLEALCVRAFGTPEAIAELKPRSIRGIAGSAGPAAAVDPIDPVDPAGEDR